MPPAKELAKLIQSFKAMTKTLLAGEDGSPPLATTVCRSGRDGYSPARPLAAVERAVVKHLREILPVLEMVYDDELLGGAAGWRAVLDQAAAPAVHDEV